VSVGTYNSLQVVNGNPAISYYDASTLDLKFVRATDANGTAWGSPQTIDATGNVGQYSSMQVVNGNPAIAYYDLTNTNLKYVRATNADGTTWGTPQTLDVPTGTLGQYAYLQIINGNPAIAYYDATGFDLKFIRANDANGDTWGAAVTIDATGSVGVFTSLQTVNGYPGISYYDATNANLKFVRATDANGAAWGTPLTIDAAPYTGTFNSLQIVNGNPAISYYDSNNGDLKFVRATDASGTAWATPQVLYTSETAGQHTSMVSQGTGAAIAFYNGGYGVPFFVATTDFISLPVTLTRFAALWKNTAIQLNWQVDEESNIDRYIVERSADGKTFSKLGSVTAVNEVHSHNYSYTDGSPLEGTNYYRLRIEETTGTVRYSTIVSLRANSTAGENLSVYPNPVRNNSLQFEASLPAGAYKLKVVNSAGVEVMSVNYQHGGGMAVQPLPVPHKITKGVYHLVISSSKVRVTTTFIK
jgi:hypothetical protein